MKITKTKIPRINPIIDERRGFVDIKGPREFTTLLPNNAAIKNSKGRATINKI